MSDLKVRKTIQDSTAVGEAAASPVGRASDWQYGKLVDPKGEGLSKVVEGHHGAVPDTAAQYWKVRAHMNSARSGNPGKGARKSKAAVSRKAVSNRDRARVRPRKSHIEKSTAPLNIDRKPRRMSKFASLEEAPFVSKKDISLGRIDDVPPIDRKPILTGMMVGRISIHADVVLQRMSGSSSIMMVRMNRLRILLKEERKAVLQRTVSQASIKKVVIKNFSRHAIAGVRMVRACAALRSMIKVMGRVGRVLSVRSVVRSSHSASRGMCLSACAMTGALEGTRMRGVLAAHAMSGQDSAVQSQKTAKGESALIFQAGQMVNGRGKSNSQVPAEFTSLKMLHMLARRGHAQLNPALWCPSGTIDQQNPYSPSIPKDEELFSVAAIRERAAGEVLVTKIIEQLKLGPAQIENDVPRREANAALPESYEPIQSKDWKTLVRKTLNYAVGQVKIFDDRGIRKPEEIYEDALGMLELDRMQFAEWETFFGINGIVDNLMDTDYVSSQEDEKPLEEFVSAIEKRLAAIASGSVETGEHRVAHEHLFETKCQWLAARYSDIRDKECKIARTTSFITGLAKRDRVAAGMVLGLIVRHSVLSEHRPLKGALVPRWRVSELRPLLNNLLESPTTIVSDVSFRSVLTGEQNEAVNELIYRINYGGVMEKLGEMEDVVIDKCLRNIKKADESGKVFREIIMHMLENHEKFKSS